MIDVSASTTYESRSTEPEACEFIGGFRERHVDGNDETYTRRVVCDSWHHYRQTLQAYATSSERSEGIFSRGGQNHRNFKKSTRFRRAAQKINHFSSHRRRKRNFLRFLRRFRLKYRVSSASAEGASENFRVFCRTAAYGVFFFKFQCGGKSPSIR